MSGGYQIIELEDDNSGIGYRPYGAAEVLWKSRDPEIMISGPAETGKTLACLHKLDALMWKYPNAISLMVRKSYKSAVSSVVQSYERKILGAWNSELNEGAGGFDQRLTPVQAFGGEHPEFFEYPNGSRIYVGGMDNPDKVLSSERDVIYVNQSEELQIDDWEKLTTRVTGRAGNMPYAQMIGDCNPWAPRHWILARRDAGKLKFLESRHEDNPILYDHVQETWTDQGVRTLAVLDALTGVRKQRLRYGRWVAAEGVVYEEFDRAIHMIKRFSIPSDWRRFISIDWGYTNPFSASWWAIDPDGRMYHYRQVYTTRRLVEDLAKQAKHLSSSERIEAVVADHDAEDRATWEKHFGQAVIPATKAISTGLQAVKNRLLKAGDGKPRIYFLEDSLVARDPDLDERKAPACTEDEFDAYIWPVDQSGKPNKEVPVDANNHGMDEMRYGVMYADNPPASLPDSQPEQTSRWGAREEIGGDGDDDDLELPSKWRKY